MVLSRLNLYSWGISLCTLGQKHPLVHVFALPTLMTVQLFLIKNPIFSPKEPE